MEKKKSRFSASKREFLKSAALFTVYIGPVMKTFEMAVVSSKATGPVKKKDPDSGEVGGA